MEVKRATYESVQNSQNTFFFDLLKQLEEKEETLDSESRSDYFRVFADSFLGVERNYHYKLYHNDTEYDLGTLSSYARKLAYLTDDDIKDEKKAVIFAKGRPITVPLKILWRSLRECLYDPTADALNLSLRTSAEQITRESGVYEFKVDKQINK